MLFQVEELLTNNIYEVYSIRSLDQSSLGNTQFLIYKLGNWMWVNASEFKPLLDE